MKNFRLILSVDEVYARHLPLVIRAYRKFFDCYVSVIAVSDNLVHVDGVDTLLNISPFESVPVAHACKMAFLWLSTMYEDEVVLINGADQVPLSAWYINALLDVQKISNKIVVSGKEMYDRDAANKGKFPTGYLLGRSDDLAQMINPKHRDFLTFWRVWCAAPKMFDDKENPLTSKEFSDESLVRKMIKVQSYIGKFDASMLQHVNRSWGMQQRIDRSNMQIDLAKLQRGEYVEAHLPRPDELLKVHHDILWDYING